MPAFRDTPVAVLKQDGGVVRIGSKPGGLLTQILDLAGGMLVVNVDNPAAAPFAEITDVTQASWWLSFVFGDDVADAVMQLQVSDDDQQPAPVARAGMLANAVLRFAVGLWLYRWWPSSDRPGVPELTEDGERWLETELGVLAWYAEEAFGSKSIARGFLTNNVAFVIDDARQSSGTRRLLAAVRATIECVPTDDLTYRTLFNLENAFIGAAAEMPDLESALDEFDDLALVLGGELAFRGGEEHPLPPDLRSSGRVVASGTSTVEWGRVRSRALGSQEENVRWTLTSSPDETLTLAVEVPVGDRWKNDQVYAAVFVGDATFPADIADLQVHPADVTLLVGKCDLSGSITAADLAVTVFGHEDIAGDCSVARTVDDRSRIVDKIHHLRSAPGISLDDVAAYEYGPADPWPVPGRD